nr:NADH dehydrogenase (ubiquinone) 1 beta [Hymenolepis microstoma]
MSPGFDPWKYFHESPEEQAAINARAQYRNAMKEEYRRIKTNPINPPQGVIHDPNMQRWFSARVTYAEYVKPSTKGCFVVTAFFGFFGLIYLGLSSRRNRRLAEIERGEVDYKTRALKFDPR